jgi:hypothetical protein
MKILAEKFTKRGFKHTLVKREGDVAIYKRCAVESLKRFHYEVVIITRHDGISIEGNYIEPGELYPSGSQWGFMGWTCSTEEDAEKRFQKTKIQLKESQENKEKKSKVKKNKK